MLTYYIPHTLAELNEVGPMNSGDLSEAIWGTSGRGNTRLTKTLFPMMARSGYVEQYKAGRSIMFKITDKGRTHVQVYEAKHGKIETRNSYLLSVALEGGH